MKLRFLTVLLSLLVAPLGARAEEAAVPDIGTFAERSQGGYQVLAQGGGELAGQINSFMNEMLKQYSKFFSNWTPKNPARVIVFDNREDFRAYTATVTSRASSNVLGYCHLRTDGEGRQFFELVAFHHEDLWGTLAHEGFHQFIGYELGQEIPTWLNEGLAQYFETSTVVRGKFVTGGVNRLALNNAQALLHTKQAPALTTLFSWDQRTFYANADVAYPLSWALVYYLLENEGRSFHNSALRKYLQDLKWGRATPRSFTQRFGRDTEALQAAFRRYTLQLRP